MIYPHLEVQVWKNRGHDLYGEPVFERIEDERCAPVKLILTATHTTVRTDSAGTKGHAQEITSNTVILVRPGSEIRIDDKLVIHDHPLRVIGRHPRYTVSGRLDHHELQCEAWS